MTAAAALKEGIDRFSDWFATSRRVVPFTGAGVSTESGIPDFRSPGGLWSVNRPIPFADFLASAEARAEAWRRRFAMEAVFAAARPGRAHHALAAWIASGRSPAVVTQNIDDLHRLSGVEDEAIVEIHGNTTYATCLSCGRRHDLAPIRTAFERDGAPPSCAACGGILKTATISFGQAMPPAPMRRATELALGCDLFVAIGSSLVVHPAAGLPLIARRGRNGEGARLVIINREETPCDGAADLVLRGDVGDILEAVRDRVPRA